LSDKLAKAHEALDRAVDRFYRKEPFWRSPLGFHGIAVCSVVVLVQDKRVMERWLQPASLRLAAPWI